MRIKTILLSVLLTGVMISALFGADNEKDTYHTGPAVFQFDLFMIDQLPGGTFYTSFLENYAPDTTLLIEENNGFSIIDNPRVYFEGDSFINFNWFYNGLNINSALNDGSPAVMLPLSSIGSYRLQGENPAFKDYGLNILSAIRPGNFSRVTVSGIYSDLGGYVGTWVIQPDHPALRADRLYNERRKIKDNFYLDYQYNKTSKASHLSFGLNYFDISRQFNDFNNFDDIFVEEGKLFLANGRYVKKLSDGMLDIFAVFNHLDRDHQQAELGTYPQENSERKRLSFLTGLSYQKNKLSLGLSLQVEKEELNPVVENFSKDLMDTDGDLLLPYGKTSEFRLGDFTGTTLNANLKYPIKTRLFNRPFTIATYGDIRFSQIKGNEKIHDYNALLFDQDPYMVVKWQGGNDYTNSNLQARAGMNLAAQLSDKISLLGHVLINYDKLGFDNSLNNLSFVTPGFDVGIHVKFSKRKNSHLLFSYGRLPYHIRENSNSFLEQQRPSGSIYHWNDSNGDGNFQAGEEAVLYGYTGGSYHYVDQDLSAPIKERLLLNFSTPISKYFTLNIKGIYKKIINNFRVRFDREYGFYETHDGHDLYFFDQPFGDYYLSNGGYEKDPFYAQFHFNFKGRRADRWFFSFSFMAHMGMGVTAFGNGPASNDIGILDESQANPNSWINGFGRNDGDRGFVSKCYLGYYLGKKLFLAVSLKYRDGNAFAFYNSLNQYEQQIIYYSTIKAEDEKGVKGGPREDYVADISVQLNYKFKLFNRDAVLRLSFFNLFDFGAELSEYVFSGGLRDAVELQIPRSMRLTFQWQF
jgi:hypothetical protein